MTSDASPLDPPPGDDDSPRDVGPDDDDLDDLTRTVRLRRRSGQPAVSDDPAEEPSHGDPDEADADDGSTMVVRRESKRRAEAAAAAGSADEEADAVTALSRSRMRRDAPATPWPAPPDPREEPPRTYPPRAADPVIVPRTPPVPREPQRPVDTAAIDLSSRRRARRRLIAAVVAASAIAVVAIAGIALLLTAF